MKKFLILPTIIASCLVFCSVHTSPIYADSIAPTIYEKSIPNNSKVTGYVTYKNESDQPSTITPKVSAYDPKNEILISDEKTLFIRMDKETYTVEPQKSIKLSYEIIPPTNLEPGTYANVIIMQKDASDPYFNQKNTLGTVETLSQLVVIHTFDSQTNPTLEIGPNFAQITMTIEDAGIPFIKPLKIKYTYQNTTQYILEPQGEIQIFDMKSSYSPNYIQINTDAKKLYPGDTVEEIITVKDWHISDVIWGRKIVGRFYNGIDQNTQTKDLTQNSYYAYLLAVAVVVLLLVMLIKSIQKDRKK